MNSQNSQLTPGGAWAMGSLFIVAGIFPIVLGLGLYVPPGLDPRQAPPWVAVCAGLMFVIARICIVLDYGIAGGVGPDGDLPPGTPMAIRVGNLVLGGTLVGLMTTIFGWVAFGPGPRHFSSTVYLPLVGVAARQRSGELSGRIMFGAITVLMGVMFVVCTIVGIKRLWRARNSPGVP